jgi:hypothetical protein
MLPKPKEAIRTLTFVVELDVAPNTAKLMVDRSGDWMFKGRKVTFYAPRIMD